MFNLIESSLCFFSDRVAELLLSPDLFKRGTQRRDSPAETDFHAHLVAPYRYPSSLQPDEEFG